MNPRTHELRLEICRAEIEILYDIYLCAEEFKDLVDTFKEKFLNKDITISMAFYDDILSGFIVAEDKSQKVDAIEKLIPTTCLHLLYVNSKFRKKHIGKFLFDEFIKTQKEKGIASIYIKIPQKYKIGINFLQRNDFRQIDKIKSKIILEKKLWNDYGIGDCQIIGDNVNDLSS